MLLLHPIHASVVRNPAWDLSFCLVYRGLMSLSLLSVHWLVSRLAMWVPVLSAVISKPVALGHGRVDLCMLCN